MARYDHMVYTIGREIVCLDSVYTCLLGSVINMRAPHEVYDDMSQFRD